MLRPFLPISEKVGEKDLLLLAQRLTGFSFTFPADLFLDAKDRSQLLLLLPKGLPIDQGVDEGGEEGGGAGEGDAGEAACLENSDQNQFKVKEK